MTKVNVFSPVRNFTGVSVGVVFSNGRGLVEEDSPAWKYFKRRGYRLGGSADDEDSDPAEVISDVFNAADGESGQSLGPEKPEDPQEPAVDIPGMPKTDATRGEFAEFAESMGLETEGLTKAKIIEKIMQEASRG